MTFGVPLSNLIRVPVGVLEPHPDNVRDDVGDVRELAQSISEVGLLQPIVAVPHGKRLRIIAGHRRFAACQLARLKYVPVIVRPELVGDAAVEVMLVENLHRVDLSPIEEARAIARLVHLGQTQQEIAGRIGRSNAFVSKRLLLLTLPPEIQGRLTAKLISLGEAERIARLLDGRTPEQVDRGWSTAHLASTHALAPVVRSRCADAGHGLRRRIGQVACGECWEAEIRADERQRLTSIPAQAVAS